jgi:hypothetical protein
LEIAACNSRAIVPGLQPTEAVRRFTTWLRVSAAAICAIAAAATLAAQKPSVSNVILVTIDGLRWQEVFGGLSDELANAEQGVADRVQLQQRFGGSTPVQRREKLMPFFWTTIATEGQVFGDPSRGSVVRATNGVWISYPGYNELLSGFADPRIDSNNKVDNPNVTVLEWLNRRAEFKGKVAAFASWALLPWILNEQRSGIPSNSHGRPPIDNPVNERHRAINDIANDLPPYWSATRTDTVTRLGALEYLTRYRPRILYVMLGEADEWAHGRRYDLYLDAAWRNDRFIAQLWQTAQSLPEYANKTALVLTTDHGRGETPADWVRHGRAVPAADRVWIALMGPTVQALGVRSNQSATLSQVAATIGALLGQDFVKAESRAALPLDSGPSNGTTITVQKP